ncbi:hypothetical protein C0U44_30225 [Klebsiella pneumoniae]|nr:hypothetical protein C0U44_30225 [Klebsiella pneumoniae]
MTLSQDILAELAEIAPGSPLDQARAVRDAATRHAQGSYEVLFRQQDAEPSHRDTLRSIELIAQHIAPHIR